MRSRSSRGLQSPKLVDRDVAAHEMAGLGLDERRLCLLAHRADLPRAARVEDAPGRGRRGARDVALEAYPVPSSAVDRRHGREKSLRVRVMRPFEDGLGRCELLQTAQVQDGDAVRDVSHDTEIVRDEEVGDAPLRLELDQEVEDRRLHRYVECRGRLVADDQLGIAGKRACDRHALLEATGQLHGLLRQRSLGQPDSVRELEHLRLCRLPSDSCELLEGAEQDPADRMAPVQGRVGILEDDLERAKLRLRALLVARREGLPVERDRSVGRRNDSEHRAGKRCLPTSRLADEAQRLAGPDRGADVPERLDVVPLLTEDLRQPGELDERCARPIDGGELEVGCFLTGKPVRALVVPASAHVSRCDDLEWWLLTVTALVREGAAVGEHAPRELGAEAGEEAGNRVEPPMILPDAASRDAAKEADRVRVARIAEHGLDRPLLHEAPRVEDSDARTHRRDDTEVVADEENRRVQLRLESRDEVEHLGLHGRVEAGRRLVEDQKLRVLGQRHGDERALLHATGELMWVSAHHRSRIRDLDALQGIASSLGAPRSSTRRAP